MAARAYAALRNRAEVTNQDLKVVTPLAFQHRRMGMEQNQETTWSKQDEAKLDQILGSE
jgi:Mg-chelatase subunit ChlI